MKITIPSPAAQPPQDKPPQPADQFSGRLPADYPLKVGGIVGRATFIVSLLWAGAGVIFFSWGADLSTIIYRLLIAVILSALAGVTVGAIRVITWSTHNLTRPWDLENEDRYYIMDRGVSDPLEIPPAADTSPNGKDIAAALFTILRLHFNSGLQCTRRECNAYGIDQITWGRVNQILKALGIKSGRGWEVKTIAAAYKMLNPLGDIESDRYWIKKDNSYTAFPYKR